ncbi:toll/interleukin-1 receptor domain-containing protein [Pengzhenrongella phosphoraccumulans]|uniref:toll/interleukin-1 receptor domain-containing protein n=1 Tax=Pengzhenrongella phosphoraccumulans TaxID=3114394 RepID=UPI0038903431
MSPTYGIEIFHLDRDRWAADLTHAVAQEVLEIGLHPSVSVVVGPPAPSGSVPTVGVYLGSAAAAADATLGGRIKSALTAGTVVIPVVDALAQFGASVPASLTFANGFEWTSPESARKLARILLENLGIEENERRVFISHKRDDGLGAAEQLHDRLTHVGFRPFIDRFFLRAGEDVQERIADVLEDYAFLLLLETPMAHTSRWVFDELHYALSHTMATLILRWPGEPTPVPGSPGVPREQLRDDELVKDVHEYDTFTDAALDRVVAAVEASHANGLARRRRTLVQSIEEAAKVSGCTSCTPLPGWQLRVEHAAGPTLVGITPRLPTADDLHKLDLARGTSGVKPAAVLVYSARALRPARRAHLEWVAGDRDLTLEPGNAIGGRW